MINGKKIKKIIENNSKENNDDLLNEAIHNNKIDCKTAFMSINVPEPRGPILIFGEYFMKKFYTVFDRDQKVIGFSIANQNNFINNDEQKKKLMENIITPYDNDDIDENNEIENVTKNPYPNKEKNLNRIRFIERNNNIFNKKISYDKTRDGHDDVLLVHP